MHTLCGEEQDRYLSCNKACSPTTAVQRRNVFAKGARPAAASI